MKEHVLIQGSTEWHAHRAKYRNASDTPSVTGHSPYKSRSAFLKERATGVAPDVDHATQRRFDDGHRYESLSRPLMEEIIGQEVYPTTGTEGLYSASFDGLTMLGDIAAEHKTLNNEIRACSNAAELPIYYREQMEHQLMVSGAEKCLFMATLWDLNDNLIDKVHFWYEPDMELRRNIVTAWEQFEKDLADYVPEPTAAPAPIGRTPETLPALRIEVTGMVTNSNLPAFREHAIAVFDSIKTDLQTDADFADAEKAVKWCKDVEDKLDAAKQHALSQTSSIDELFRVIDDIKESARQKRLALDKLVKAEKDNRKSDIVHRARVELVGHIESLHKRIGVSCIPVDTSVFAESIKGLKSLDSMRDKVSVALANAKIEANATADRIDANRKSVDDMSLVPDFAQVCTKSPDDFGAMLAIRKQQRAESEAKKLESERERIRREEWALARDEALKKTAPEIMRKLDEAEESGAMPPDIVSDVRKTTADLATELAIDAAKSADNGKTVTLGQINALLSPVRVDQSGLASLGISPVGRERAAVLFRESDIEKICAELIRHLSAITAQHRRAA